ncbi:two-component system regulatory protein YycI [Loigolactobacillus zhaoyuanensis]|uniref:two-component system regulatory protein YycI n=1 Tax=Loigolactobacillus zhaoyuanensis TaxID=2486017 RepID=UPI000F744FC7|nr:two-component system regulatory protein YycI [Loigolactobacillus zhaoyuanensis]
MDFKRIEVIFLIVFGCLNIFLFASYKQNQHVETVNNDDVSQNTMILREMHNDQITVPTLANKVQSGYYLSSHSSQALQTASQRLQNQRYSFSDDRLYSRLVRPISAKDGKYTEALKEILTNPRMIALGTHYRYSKLFSTTDRIVYTQKLPEGDLYDAQGEIIFQVTNKQIVSYEQTYINKVTTLREKEPTITEKQAVLSLYSNNAIANGATIKWTTLGYSRLLDANNSSVYIPTWFIGVENKNSGNIQIKRINAFSNALMKASDDANLSSSVSS